MSKYPKQIDNIEINKVSDGYIIYHTEFDRVHYLNMTAALLLESCDGETSLDEIKIFIKDVFELDEIPAEEIDSCMEELMEASLVKL